MRGIFKLVIVGTSLFGLAGSASAQDQAAASVGSWRGSVVTFDLASDGKFSYKEPRDSQPHRQLAMAPND